MAKRLKIAKDYSNDCKETRYMTGGERGLLRLRLRLLKNFNAFTKFKVNLQNYRKHIPLSDSIIIKSIVFDNRFIDIGFVWNETYEGHHFWRQINNISKFL